jgi:hypothetical protein
MKARHFFPVLLFGAAGISSAQVLGPVAPIDPGQNELTYFLGQWDSTKAAVSRLQALMDELEKKYAADPDADLRQQIREYEAFVAKLQNLCSDAQGFADAALLSRLVRVASDALESTNNLKSNLAARERAPNPERVALKGHIDKLQKEIDLSNKLAKTLADTIKSIQDDRRREGVGSELDALVKPEGLPDPGKER